MIYSATGWHCDQLSALVLLVLINARPKSKQASSNARTDVKASELVDGPPCDRRPAPGMSHNREAIMAECGYQTDQPFGTLQGARDLGDFSRNYGLTRAEERLCVAFINGGSLSDAAVACDISYETAHSRIKDIFNKTQTAKQANLLLMLEQFRTD